MCPPWTEFEVDSLSGLVVGRASYGGRLLRRRGQHSATGQDVSIRSATATR